MATHRFEGSYLGDATRLPPTARMECKICWHVYDPHEGCDVWQVLPGTPFAALPEEWRCPRCDGDRDQFMVLDGGAGEAWSGGADASPVPVAADASNHAADAARRFEACFREVHAGQMRGVPLVNEALGVKAVGFRPHDGSVLGVVVTPWFMNLVLAPGPDEDWSALVAGEKDLVEFPSGRYAFITARRDGLGTYKACSLFSPMFEFASLLQATDTAVAALTALFDPSVREDGDRADEIRRRREEDAARAAALEDPDGDDGPPAQPSRRTLILGPGARGRLVDTSS